MKKWIAFLLASVMLLAGCAASGTATEFTPEVQKEIEEAWLAENKDEIGTWYEEPNNTKPSSWRVRYLGTFEGYIIFFWQGETFAAVEETKIIANEKFPYHDPFSLYAYKDKEFLELEDAYESDCLSAEAISNIADIFESTFGKN